MVKTFKGNSPKNARIKINYEGIKPIVRFSYPCKKRQESGTMLYPIIMCWLVFIFLVGAIHGIYLDIKDRAIELDSNCTAAVENYAKNNLTDIQNEVCTISFFEKFNYGIESNIKSKFYSFSKKSSIFVGLLFFLWMFLPPLLIYFPFRKRWANVFPKYQALLASKKIRKFTSKDIEYNEKSGYFCEVPVFHNVILNFEATKEFSKYLREFEIREHNFRLYKLRRKLKKKHWGKYKPPKTFNEFVWYARFYFTEKPHIGKLEVLFK